MWQYGCWVSVPFLLWQKHLSSNAKDCVLFTAPCRGAGVCVCEWQYGIHSVRYEKYYIWQEYPSPFAIANSHIAYKTHLVIQWLEQRFNQPNWKIIYTSAQLQLHIFHSQRMNERVANRKNKRMNEPNIDSHMSCYGCYCYGVWINAARCESWSFVESSRNSTTNCWNCCRPGPLQYPISHARDDDDTASTAYPLNGTIYFVQCHMSVGMASGHYHRQALAHVLLCAKQRISLFPSLAKQ